MLSDLATVDVRVPDGETTQGSAAAILDAYRAPIFLGGTAYGGCVALEAAVQAPDRVRGLVLMNASPGAHPDPREAEALCDRIAAAGIDELLAAWSGLIVAPHAQTARDRFAAMARDAGPALFVRQYRASARRRDHWDALPSLSMPVLLIWGADDVFVPVETGRRMSLALPNARWVPLPRGRHFPPLEQPEETGRLMRDWLEAALRDGAA